MNIRQLSVLCLLLLSVNGYLQAQSAGDRLWHVEPPCWWTGLQDPHLQILVHGPDIAVWNPVIQDKHIRIDSIVRTDNDNYLFLYLRIRQQDGAGPFTIRFKKQGEPDFSYSYPLRERDHGSRYRKGFSNEDVLCLITPDRFANGDPSNDSHPSTLEKANRTSKNGRHGGDMAGVINHLDYLDQMGFTALWLNPVLENNQLSFSYHGYSITDFYRIDPRFGTNDMYLELSRKLHSRGMKLIMDQVMNHCGSNHWWTNDLPSSDWLRTTGNFGPTNHLRSTLTDPYASESDRHLFNQGAFVPTMPDMNQDNPHLARYLIQNSIWWVEYANLDGIRHDTHSYAGVGFMSAWTCSLMNEYPDFNIVGEEWSIHPEVVSKWQRGYRGSVDLGSCLPGLMDFPLQMAVSQALTEDESSSAGFIRIYDMLATDFLYPDPFNLVIFPDNHDMTRFFTQIGENLNQFKLGMTFFLTTRGIPQIYYGTEVLMTSPLQRDDGLVRSDFPGGWAGDLVNAFTGSGLKARQAEAQAYCKKLLNWRKSASVIHSGKLMHYAPHNGLYIYFRYNDHNKVMVVLNKNSQPQRIDCGRYPEMLTPTNRFREVLNGEDFSFTELVVPAESPLILEVR